MRKPIIAANWKMHMTVAESESFWNVFDLEIGEDHLQTEIVLIPPFTSIHKLSELTSSSQKVRIGAQNMNAEPFGAFTGEISAAMLRELYVRYVILGHSERRQLFGETDEVIARKLQRALQSELRTILCIGETLAERDAGKEKTVLERQLRAALNGLTPKQFDQIVIAYEPIWAIGTGRNATPAQAQDAHHFIRQLLEEFTDRETAQKVRIQYGGSVKPSNAREILSEPDIDGALVGGASLDPRSFAEIVKSVPS